MMAANGPERSTALLGEFLDECRPSATLGEFLGEMALLIGCHKTYQIRYLKRRIDELEKQR